MVLSRPGKHNALRPKTFHDLVAAARAVPDDVRAVILRGDGPSFCSGLDFPAVADAGRDALVNRAPGEAANLVQLAALVWRDVRVPVIAALHGHVLGGGLQIALGADLRIAAPDASLAFLEVAHGLVPDMGVTVTLPALMQQDAAKELVWTGQRISGREAKALGLVTHVADEPHAAAVALAASITERSMASVREAKALLSAAWPDPQLLSAESAAQDRLRALQT